MLLSLLTLALADEPAPVPGLADLHLHQWAEYNYAGEFYAGKADGPASVALAPCGLAFGGGWIGQTPPTTKHGQLGGLLPGDADFLTRMGLTANANDDARQHPPLGWSDRSEYPPFLGWPTSDSVAHQQAWTGWLRLAHEGLPLRWYMTRNPAGDDHFEAEVTGRQVWQALPSFYADYRENMRSAAEEGYAGLNLVVTSLVASANGCRGIVSKQRRKNDPDACYEPNILARQYAAAESWAERNRDWAEIVTTPEQARQVIEQGRLAVVLSLESSDVLREYVTRIKAVDAEHPAWSKESVMQALRSVLDEMPRVSTLGLTHQLDNPFGGGAVVALDLFALNRQRVVPPEGGEPPEEPRVMRDPALLSRGNEDRVKNAETYAKLWYERTLSATGKRPVQLPTFARAVLTPRRAVTSYASTTWPAADGDERAFPRKADGQGPYVAKNRYGLSYHGELLLEVMAERHMPVDLSHASDALVRDMQGWFAERRAGGLPVPQVYLSHAYPRDIDATPNELHVATETLAWVAREGGVAGVRPGDDHVLTARIQPRMPDLARILEETSCQGTSVATLAFAATLRAAGGGADQPPLALAFGTDLNGFINQPGPTGGPRIAYEAAPCSGIAANVGSEVGTRGLAHVGLLPTLLLEMQATHRSGRLDRPGGSDKEHALLADTLSNLSQGADSYVRMWTRAYGHDEIRGLPTSSVPATHLPRPLEGRPVGRLDVALPFFRAIEGLLPYVTTADRGSAVLFLPQLPTNLGLLVGWKTWGMQRPRKIWRPEWKRCKQAWGARACGDLEQDMRAAERPWVNPLNRSRTWGLTWDREFLGDHREFGAWIRRLGSDGGGSGDVSGHLGGVASATRSWLLDTTDLHKGHDHLACLDDRTFAEAPVPTLSVGNDQWMRCRLNDPLHAGQCDGAELPSEWAWRDGDPLLPDNEGRPVSCYCDLLSSLKRGVDEAGADATFAPSARDEYILALCTQSMDARRPSGGRPVLTPPSGPTGPGVPRSLDPNQGPASTELLPSPEELPTSPEIPSSWDNPDDARSRGRATAW